MKCISRLYTRVSKTNPCVRFSLLTTALFAAVCITSRVPSSALPNRHVWRTYSDRRLSFNDYKVVWGQFTKTTLDAWLSSLEGATSSLHDLGDSWYKHENICVDGSDGIKYVDATNSYVKLLEPRGMLNTTLISYKPVPLDNVENDSLVYEATGNTALFHCYGVVSKSSNSPFHFLFGYGTLYRGILLGIVPKKLDNIIMHQCAEPFQSGYFYSTFWEILVRIGFERGVLTSNTRFFGTGKGSPLICTKGTIGHEPAEKPYWFGTYNEDMNSFHQNLANYISLPLKEKLVAQRGSDGHARIAIFQRSGGQALRRYSNLEQIMGLVSSYDKYFQLITVNETTSLVDVVKIFNSFDILITTVGSHLANLHFSFTSKLVLIETVVFRQTNEHSEWLRYSDRILHILSSMHHPADPILLPVAEKCWRERVGNSRVHSANCTNGDLFSLFNSDLVVDIETLRTDIHTALNHLQIHAPSKSQ